MSLRLTYTVPSSSSTDGGDLESSRRPIVLRALARPDRALSGDGDIFRSLAIGGDLRPGLATGRLPTGAAFRGTGLREDRVLGERERPLSRAPMGGSVMEDASSIGDGDLEGKGGLGERGSRSDWSS